MANTPAKPFLKWAGGKTRLLQQYDRFLPAGLSTGEIHRYFEPLLGAGALFFHIAHHFPIRSACLSDANPDLILTYRVVQQRVTALFECLHGYAKHYSRISVAAREAFFYLVRTEFNRERGDIDYRNFSEKWVRRAGQLIFLNRVCYNGLFRTNRNGHFNVPFGKYKRPKILDAENLQRVSEVLQMAEIRMTDFSSIEHQTDARSFVYYDPPYRPISRTSAFTSYNRGNFDDREQSRLAQFYRKLHQRQVKQMLSNSDPQNSDPQDRFFERLYADFKIYRIQAGRSINCDGRSRGKISELVIVNY